jgi:hypothetical protein
MLELCENFANQNNLQFSTDINPTNSKSKCTNMCGKVNNVVYLIPLQLYGVILLWVTHATRLGHELHQDCTMEYDAKIKRGDFIRSSKTSERCSGLPTPCKFYRQSVCTLHIFMVLCYGTFMGRWQVFRAWNTCVKLAWGVPRWTHNHFVDVLAGNLPSVRKKVFGQYIRFSQKLLSSNSPEITMLANIVGRNMGSVTGKNLYNLENEFGLDPGQCSPGEIR